MASLSWQTYNIGAHTKLIYNQSAGGTLANTWVAINTITDPLQNPSTILGQISAPGKIFILNPYGVLFGAGSQLNLGSLVASTAIDRAVPADHGQQRPDQRLFALRRARHRQHRRPHLHRCAFRHRQHHRRAPGASITTTAPAGTQSGG